MKKFAVIISFTIVFCQGPYVSPGVQLGYGFQEHVLYLSGQVTVGWFTNTYLNPGITLGLRHSKEKMYHYVDLQNTLVDFGFGIGLMRNNSDSNDKYIKSKLWFWIPYNYYPHGLLAFENLAKKDDSIIPQMGIFFVFPVLTRVDGISY